MKKTAVVGIDEMVAALRTAHGAHLRALVLYGSAAAERDAPASSDINLLVVVDAVEPRALADAAPHVVLWGEAGNPPPLLFTVDEWNRSADIYPMEYLDVLEGHQLLAGDLSLSGMAVDMAHLRLQLEQEFMGKVLALRQGIMLAGEDAASLQILLEGAARKTIVLLRGLVRLHAEKPPRPKGELVAAATRLAGVDCSVFLRVLNEAKANASIQPARGRVLLDEMRSALDAVASHVNRYVPGAVYHAGIHSEEQGRSQ